MQHSRTGSPRSFRPRNSRQFSCPLSVSSFRHPEFRPCESCWAGCRGHSSFAAAVLSALYESVAWKTQSSYRSPLLKTNGAFTYSTTVENKNRNSVRNLKDQKNGSKKALLDILRQIFHSLEWKDKEHVETNIFSRFNFNYAYIGFKFWLYKFNLNLIILRVGIILFYLILILI